MFAKEFTSYNRHEVKVNTYLSWKSTTVGVAHTGKRRYPNHNGSVFQAGYILCTESCFTKTVRL